MKRKFATLLMLILSFGFVLVGCGVNLAMPAQNAEVIGNGGFVVQKGEYIYFANAYTGYSTIGSKTSNDFGKVVEYSLYRVKVSSVNNKTIEYDENGLPKNVEQVVSKVVGFENSGFYIFGDYLFFASPNIHKTKEQKNRYDLISFFSVKLDGTNLQELYTTSGTGEWSVLSITENNKTYNYLVTIEKIEREVDGTKKEVTDVVRHTISNGKLEDKTVLVQNATSAVMAKEVKYAMDKYVYFTASRSKQETDSGISGNLLKRVNVHDKTINDFSTPSGNTITLIKQQNGVVFYTKQTNTVSGYYYYRDITGQEKQLTSWTGITNLIFMGYENGNALPVVYNYQNSLVMQNLGSFEVTVLSSNQDVPIFVWGDYIYIKTSKGISRISYKDKQEQVVVEATVEENQYDFDGRFVYVYSKLDSSKSETLYIHRVDTYAIEQQTAKELKKVGYILKEDLENKESEE